MKQGSGWKEKVLFSVINFRQIFSVTFFMVRKVWVSETGSFHDQLVEKKKRKVLILYSTFLHYNVSQRNTLTKHATKFPNTMKIILIVRKTGV